MSREIDTDAVVKRLVEAGFTTDELEAVANDLLFATMAARETGESFTMSKPNVDWTPEKEAAWATIFRRDRPSEDDP